MTAHGTFCTAINCMDGRTQLPVNAFLRAKLKAAYVDTITEPGPDGILAAQADRTLVESILSRIRISVEKHGSQALALVAHHDCAGNPVDKTRHIEQLRSGRAFLNAQFPGVMVFCLWIGPSWQVEEV